MVGLSVKVTLTNIPTVYINMDARTDLRERMESMFSRLGFTNVHRSPGVVVPDAPVCVGISYAFKNAFDLARSVSNGGPFLMLEDDVIPRQSFAADIEVPDDFDAVYLGISSWGLRDGVPGPYTSATYVSDTLARLHTMLSGHAILYAGSDKEYTKTVHGLMDASAQAKTYQDIEFAKTMPHYNVYAFVDPVFYQTSQAEPTNLKLTDFVARKRR